MDEKKQVDVITSLLLATGINIGESTKIVITLNDKQYKDAPYFVSFILTNSDSSIAEKIIKERSYDSFKFIGLTDDFAQYLSNIPFENVANSLMLYQMPIYTFKPTTYVNNVLDMVRGFGQDWMEMNNWTNRRELQIKQNNGQITVEIDTVFRDLSSTTINSHSSTGGNTSKDGCYVATAVYGSYDCPQVWTLRRYRDYYLDKYWLGRIFIRVYYAISPSLVKRFKNNTKIKKYIRKYLDKKVRKLNKLGYKNCPYVDKKVINT